MSARDRKKRARNSRALWPYHSHIHDGYNKYTVRAYSACLYNVIYYYYYYYILYSTNGGQSNNNCYPVGKYIYIIYIAIPVAGPLNQIVRSSASAVAIFYYCLCRRSGDNTMAQYNIMHPAPVPPL